MRAMNLDEEEPMLSRDEGPSSNRSKVFAGVLISAAFLLGAACLMIPRSHSGDIELQGRSDLWSLSIPDSLKNSLDNVYENVKDGVNAAHKGAMDQVWQTKHPEMMDKFNKYDVNSDGMIDSDELVTWVFGPKNADKKAVQKSVDCFLEKFGSKGGKLSPQEMYYVFAPIIKSTEGYLSNETMATMVNQDPINLDNTILCLALVSQDPPKREDDPCADVAEAIGRKILESGTTLAGIFRSWDQDKSGFLSLPELNSGLQTLSLSHSFSDDEVSACMSKIDSLGKEDQRISIFEFIRALAPRHVTLELQRSMIREVDWDAFVDCVQSLRCRRSPSWRPPSDRPSEVREVNEAIEDMGLPVLTPTQQLGTSFLPLAALRPPVVRVVTCCIPSPSSFLLRCVE
eukprot:Skav209786  [mRNA]  locus=scaffold9:664485:670088:- [translate_table: standard]